MIATDFEEVAAICNRAIVFSQGQVTAEIARAELSVQSLLQAASAGGCHATVPDDRLLLEGVPA